MMQNLPFLVTQNVPNQKTTGLPAVSKPIEVTSSFKQVLSQQVNQEVTKTSAEKSPQNKTTKTQKTTEVAQVASKQAQTNANQASANDNVNSVDETQHITSDGSGLALPKGLSDAAEQIAQLSINSEEQPQATPAEMNAALVASLQLPARNGESVKINSADLSDALATNSNQMTGNRMATEKPMYTLEKNTLTQHDAETELVNNNALIQEQPSGAIGNEHAERFSAALNAKLPTELSAKAMPEAANKLTQDMVVQTQTAAMSMLPAAALTKVSAATQVELGSANLITPYFGKAGWDQAISQKVVWMVGANEQTATLTLNPPDLGPLQVVVSVNNDKADTTFISENPEVRKALENGMPTLRNLMGQAGIELGQTNIGTGRQQQDFQQAARERMVAQEAANATPQFVEKQTPTRVTSRINNGLVDTFA